MHSQTYARTHLKRGFSSVDAPLAVEIGVGLGRIRILIQKGLPDIYLTVFVYVRGSREGVPRSKFSRFSQPQVTEQGPVR